MRTPIVALAAFATLSCTTVGEAVPADREAAFDRVLEKQIAAITARDLDALLETVTTGDDLLLIFPNGGMTRTRTEYVDFHREWFADPNWTMPFEPISKQVEGSYGHALYRVRFDADGPDGPAPAGQSLVSLGFRLENGEWRLVHDQNTRVPPPEPVAE